MKDQHKLIRGYRDLTAADIALMNALKRQEASLQRILADTTKSFMAILESEATNGLLAQPSYHDKVQTHNELMEKAKDQLMLGFMLAIRAVAQPQPLQEEKTPFVPWRKVSGEALADERLKASPDQLVLAINEDGQLEQTTFSTVRSSFARTANTPGAAVYYRAFCPLADLPLPKE